MQIKTIRKVITKKLEEWLETITDTELRKQVKENILVSGGSITSMLLDQPVNDYDIYIQDMNVLIKLANYYCPGKVLDGRKRLDYLEGYAPMVWNEGKEVENHSEEYVRKKTLKENQVKLDIPSIGERFDKSEDDDSKYTVAFLSQNAISLTDDIQIVLRFNGTPEEIHKTFDFIHATNYFTFKDGLVTNVEALQSILTKELKYQGSLYPLTSIIRMKKFLKRGWNINAGEMLKIMYQISLFDLTDIEVLEEQLIGVDVAYFAVLIDIIRGIPSEKRTSEYLNEIIDRVFNQHEENEE